MVRYFLIIIKLKKLSKMLSFFFTSFIFNLINIPFSNSYELNNIIILNSSHYRAGSFAFNSNGDMIIEYSYQNSRLFFGLKQNGKGYFKNNDNNETTFKEIKIGNNIDINHRFESRSLLISLKNDNSSQQYFFNTGTSSTLTELINLDTGEYKFIETYNFFGHTIYSYAFSLLSIENQNLYFAIFLSESNKNCEIKKMTFTNFNVTRETTTSMKTIDTNLDNRIVNAFIFGEKIVVLYLGNDLNYYIYINNFNFSDEDLHIFINNGGLWAGYGLFFKGIHIKNDLLGFMYFSRFCNQCLEMKIGYINSNKTFETKFFKNFSSYNLYVEDIKNDFIKINDEKLAFLGVIVDVPYKFKILIFDLYNNYEYMKIRVYDLELSNYKIDRELALNTYNNYLVFSSTVIDIKNDVASSDDNIRFSILIFFGYVNGTDNKINITDYLKDNYINSTNNIVNILTDNIQIDNNIFFFFLLRDEIKLSSIPNELLIYNSNNEKLSNGSILNKNYNLTQNTLIDKTNEYYSLDYQIIIQEPDYDTFDNIASERINLSSVDQRDYFQKQTFYGKTNTISFKLCHEYCATCKKIGIQINDQKCETCLDDYKYFFNDYSNCVEEGYFIDKDNNKKEKCTETNSKFYFDLESGKKICFKKEYECPDSYPNLNSTTFECHNRAPSSTIPKTIPIIIPTSIISTTILTTTLPAIVQTKIHSPETLFICTYIELLNKLCSFLDYNNTEIYNKIINEIIYEYPSINGESLVIEGVENYVFQLTTTENELDTLNGNYENKYNLSLIDLNECEILLKSENNITHNIPLFFLKFEKLTGIAAEKNVQYEVYEPINKNRLNLSICKNTSIDLYLPIYLSEETENLYENLKQYGYDLFNIKDAFYTDICSKYKSENETDVILSDRKKDYFTNESTCQVNCQYSEYFTETKYLKCECSAVTEEITTVDMDKFNGKMIFESFYEVLKYSNYKVLKCYKLVFNNNVISKNIGSIIVIIYFALYFPFLLLFIIKGISPLKIEEIIQKLEKESKSQVNNDKRKKSNDIYTKLSKVKKNGDKTKISNKNCKDNRYNRKNKTHKNVKNSNKSIQRNNKQRKTKNPIKRKNVFSKSSLMKLNNNKNNNFFNRIRRKIKYKTRINNNYSEIDISIKKNDLNSKRILLDKKPQKVLNIENKNMEKAIKKEEKLDNYQLNELDYFKAIELDKRPFSQIYWSLLKRNQLYYLLFFLGMIIILFMLNVQDLFF